MSDAQPTSNQGLDPVRYFILKEPRMVPRLGWPIGDFDQSLDEWIAANPHAEITIVTQYSDKPINGGIDVQLASEYVTIRESMKDCDYVPGSDDDE